MDITSDQLITELVRLRSLAYNPEDYLGALIGLRDLVMAEFSLAVTLDMRHAEQAMTLKFNEED